MNECRLDVDDIVFDLDGTLFSPLELSRQAWLLACRTLDISSDAITTENLSTCFGHLPEFIMSVLLPNSPQALKQEVCNIAYENEKRLISKKIGELYQGVEQTLIHLKRNHRLFIVSNCQSGYIEAFLKTYSFEDYFFGTLCSGDTGCSKDKNLLSLCSDYALKKPLYVGDTQQDALAAEAAGIPFVYASYGFGTVNGTHQIIHSFPDIEKLLVMV